MTQRPMIDVSQQRKLHSHTRYTMSQACIDSLFASPVLSFYRGEADTPTNSLRPINIAPCGSYATSYRCSELAATNTI
jgi:hypothetical protein